MIHELKIKKEYFEAVRKGKKTFEVRKNDRDYKVGDYLALNEIEQDDVSTLVYTGNSIIVKITYILAEPEYLKTGYVVLGIKKENFIN